MRLTVLLLAFLLIAAAITPEGVAMKGTNLYSLDPSSPAARRLTNFAGDSYFTGVTGVAFIAADAGDLLVALSPLLPPAPPQRRST